MGPDELDDLLASIRAEDKKGSALALYEGAREDDLVSEEIDERVLKLLGLDEVFDIDYGTYITLLKERLAASRSFAKKLSTEEDELLVGEFKRVKGNVGRFKVRKKKITSENIGVTGPVRVSSEKFFLTGKAVIPTSEETIDDVKDISQKLDELLKSITEQNKLVKKKEAKEKKEEEDKRRGKKESDLEAKSSRVASGILEKVVKPFQSIFDKILRFIKFTLLGFAINNFVKWFSDPDNKKKIEVLTRFLKDWWPTLATAAALFLTPFGGFVRGTIKMLRGFIPQMIRFMLAHPLVFAGVTAAVAAGAGEMWRQGEEKKQVEREATQRNVKPEVVQKELNQAKRSPWSMIGEGLSNISGVAGGGQIKKRKTFFGGGEVNVNDIGFEEGGGIDDSSGLRITGAGPDTQLIAAAPGEVVMSKKAVDRYGANFFLGLNKNAGATNIPRISNNIQLANNGGIVRRVIKSFQNGGMIGGMPPSPFGKAKPSPSRSRTRTPNLATSLQNARQRLLNRMGAANTNVGGFLNGVFPRGRGSFGYNRPGAVAPSPSIETYRMPGLNVKPIEYNYRSRDIPITQTTRTPISISMQSRPIPVGQRVVNNTTTYTILPPIESSTKPTIANRPGTDIPKFEISQSSLYRTQVSQYLKVTDLVGV